MSPARPHQIPLKDLFAEVGEGVLQSVRRPNILNYQPYPKQELFHRSKYWGRLLLGGNRAGKTDSNVAECIFRARGIHPYQDGPLKPVTQGRFFTTDLEKGLKQIALPKFQRWVPPSMLIDGNWDKSWDERGRVLTFENGSTIDFLTYMMDLQPMGGVPRDWASFDEEPPQHIFNETMQRLVDYDGIWWASMTPLDGMTWTYEYLFEPASEDPDSIQVEAFQLFQSDNPYLEAKDPDKFTVAMSEGEKEARQQGNFVAVSGKIFPKFDPATHVIDPMVPPKSWEWYMSIDHGWNNPTAILWHAVSPEGIIVTFAEHYQSHMIIDQHVKAIHAKESQDGWKQPDLRTGDPAMKQTSGITGTSIIQEYSDRDIDLAVDNVPHDVEIGIAKMQQYFALRQGADGVARPTWFITSDCVNFIKELKKLRWASYSSRKMQFELNKQEKVHKKDDHAFDSARYFATFLPDLSPDKPPVEIKEVLKGKGYVRYDDVLARMSADPEIEVLDDFDPEKSDNSVLVWDTVRSYDEFY